MRKLGWKIARKITASLACLSVAALPAQQITKAEFGIGFYSQTDTQMAGMPSTNHDAYFGPFARASLNMNQSVALEAFAFDSTDMIASGNEVGGHQVLFLAGIKAGIRRRYVGLFGRMDAGSSTYSRGLELLKVQNGPVYSP